CNSGGVAEDPKHVYLTSIANLGKGFLDVFVTFGDMVAGASLRLILRKVILVSISLILKKL
ncbi:Variable outer membrane protein, partial (plasmid) [Borrelia nietonii YOR]